MLSLQKIQNGEKKLTGNELKKIKYQIKWPKIHQKNYLFVVLYKIETWCKESHTKEFCRIFLGLTVKNLYLR